MKYLFMIYLDEKAWADLDEATRQEMMAEPAPHVERLIGEGKFVGGGPLHPTSTATTVKLRDGKPLVTDGPFAETREQLGGYALIEAADLDEAIGIAKLFLGTRSPSTIEIRPMLEYVGAPSQGG